MAIQISSDGRTFTLQTEKSSYQMMADAHDVLLHLYYGRKIAAENLEERIFRSDVGFAGNPPEAGEDRTYSLDVLPQELPGSGVGDYREDMVRLYHADGSCAADFRFESYEVQEGAYRIPGLPAAYDTGEEKGETLVITMRETASAVKVKLYYGVFEKENAITLHLDTEIPELFENEWHNRPDVARDVVRLRERREKRILPTEPQDNIYARPKGSVTIDNNLYQRYEGEIEITKRDLPCDQKVNVLGQVKNYDLALLDYIGSDTRVIFRKSNKQE